MALENLISVAFTQQELSNMDQAFSTIEKTLANKVINLTPEERQLYARVNNETEHWIEKTRNYMTQKPNLVPGWVNVAEFDKDLTARKAIKERLNRALSITESLEDTSMLLSTDIYHSAVAFYRNVKNASSENVPGSTTIYEDLATQFPGSPKSVKAKEAVTGTEGDTSSN